MSESSRAVFLSYASQDAEAARRICEALRAVGVDVWFDQSALRGGDAWDASIRRQIRECALFVPVISANTQAREEGYFRLEWKLAVDRSHLMATDKAFVLPVVIDDTASPGARVPEEFRARHWTRIPGGEASPAFCADVLRLLRPTSGPSEVSDSPEASTANAGASTTANVPPSSRRRLWLAGAAAGVLLLLAGAILTWNVFRPAGNVAAGAGTADTRQLSIVVLPFANLTGDASQDYFTDGLTAALTADLSRIRGIFVIDSATAQSTKGKAQTAQQLGQALGVRFVLQGSVQRSGSHVRINALLADATNNAQLWSDSFEGDTSNLFLLQDQVTGRIANTMDHELVVVAARDSEKRKSTPQVADLLLRADATADKPHSLEKWQEVERLLRQAIELDPGNVKATAFLADALSFKANQLRDPGLRDKARAESLELANKVIAIDPASPDPYRVLAFHALRANDPDGAQRAAETFMRLKPRQPDPYNVMGSVYMNRGDAAKAVEMFSQAVALSPKNYGNAVFRNNLARAYFMLGDYKAAIDWHSQALQAEPQGVSAHIGLAMAYAMSGDVARAQAEAREVRRLRPGFKVDVEKLRADSASDPPQAKAYIEDKMIPAYRKSGLAE
jgi:TolB-like protein/cytochrome c-type biogenesis protein CcmH/NrfG